MVILNNIIIPQVRVGYESLAHEGERNYCFSQKQIETKHLSQVKAGHQSFFGAKTLQNFTTSRL